jgi:Short C-terminal domain/Domain of unknown function (DUF4429)
MHAKGFNGQIRIEGDWLTIERKGFGRIGHSKGDKRIALGQIVAVKMRPAGPMIRGFIHFSTTGGDQLTGGLTEAQTNDNAVIFSRGRQAEFDAVREHVENYIAARSSAPPPVIAAPAPSHDPADQLRKFAQLRDEGIVSEEEFQAKKAELLGLAGPVSASNAEVDELRSRVLALHREWPGLTAAQLASEAGTTTEKVDEILGAE